MLEMAAMMLDEMGYTVLPARRPEEAIRIAEKHPDGIQLLITDVVMPGMNGKELATELLSHVPGLQCLFMSGHAADVLSRNAKLSRGINFIQKPFTLNALMHKVRTVLDNGGG
jgi:DNA-binding NtrC family response regulator